MNTIVRVVLDPELPPGKVRIGDGVRVVHCPDDAALGRELRTLVVACRNEQAAERLREIVRVRADLELAPPLHSAEPDTREAVSADDLADAIG